MKGKRDISWFAQNLLKLLILLLPTQLALHFWPDWAFIYGLRIDYLSPSISVTEIMVIIFIIVIWKRPPKWMWLVVGFAVINILMAGVKEITVIKFIKIIIVILFGIWINRNQLKVIQIVKLPLLIAVSYSFMIGILQILNGGTLGGIFYFLGERSFTISTPGIALFNFGGREWMRPYATFSHPNSLAGFALVCFFIFFIFYRKEKIGKWGMVVSFLTVVISWSLGAWIGLGVTLALWVIDKYYYSYNFYRIFLIGSIIASLVITIIGGENIRLILAMEAGEIFSKHPLFGVGLGNFILNLNGTRWFQPVHNIFLLVLSETGIIGLLGFYYLLSRVKRKYIFLVIPIIITGLFDHYWLTLQQNLILFAIVLGLAL